MTEQELRQIKMFGETKRSALEWFDMNLGMHPDGGVLLLMSILSDCQEAIERDQKEMARQWINKVKMLLSERIRPKIAPSSNENIQTN